MSALDYEVEPSVDCPDNNVNDVAFIRATTMIEGRDAIRVFGVWDVPPLG
jgi:hypothetical protein